MEAAGLSLSARESVETGNYVDLFNKKLNEGRAYKGENLEMNDFLKILTTQLSHQDPSAPMEDKEFIAQMAQFSSLKEMSGMASDMAKLRSILSGNEAGTALGRNVEIVEGDKVVQGVVKAVTRGGEPSVLVSGEFYDWAKVVKVFE